MKWFKIKQEYSTHKTFEMQKPKKLKTITDATKENNDNDNVQTSKDGSTTEVFIVEPKIENILRQFQCERCNFSTVTKGSLTHHNKASHASWMDIKCDVCIFSTTTKANLDEHIQAMHTENKSPPPLTQTPALPEHVCLHQIVYRWV